MNKQLSSLCYLVLINLFSNSIAAQTPKRSTASQNQVDVYVAGGCANSAGNYTAMYYKNGQPGIPLTNAERGSATAVTVAGTDVYVAGDLDGKAVYWKNGQLVALPSTALSPASAFSIAVSGNDVYVAGNGFKPFQDRYGNKMRDQMQPRYWKNGQEILLPQPPGPNGYEGEAGVNTIHIVDNDVYVIGRYGYMPVYWKNGQLVETIGNDLQRVMAINMLNGEVYAVGARNKQAAYWKNGQTKVLTTEESLATAVAVSGNDVYVAGVVGDNAKNFYPGYGNPGIGKYWKNGQLIELTGAESVYPTGIAIAGSDVYIVGIDSRNAAYTLLKNGQRVILTNGSCSLEAWAIATAGGKKVVNNTAVKNTLPKRGSNVAANPKDEAARFLAENKKRPGVMVTASGLQYEVVQNGTGAKPLESDRVIVNYHGTLINGEVFETTASRGAPLTISLKNGLPGIVEGIQLMNVGSKYRLVVPPDLAFGNAPAGKIKPGSVVIFEVELLGIKQ
jgi:FKBP-type peptidyl-prolyl cis-trans isomerase